jgi:hypothetical protein
MNVPGMSLMYTLCGNDTFNNENDLVYFLINYVAGRGLCVACIHSECLLKMQVNSSQKMVRISAFMTFTKITSVIVVVYRISKTPWDFDGIFTPI